jgi:hypothetical protein
MLVEIGPDFEDHLVADLGDAEIAFRFAVNDELLKMLWHSAGEQVSRFGDMGITTENERTHDKLPFLADSACRESLCQKRYLFTLTKVNCRSNAHPI